MLDKLIREINDDFPFKNYMVQKNIVRPKYFFVINEINNRFKKNIKILDFGSGKNDITTIIKRSGYENIDAFDDCNDVWYNLDNKKILDLEKVRGSITSNERPDIYITSDFAKYNYINNNSEFYSNVVIKYDGRIITCDNFNLNIKENLKLLCHGLYEDLYNNLFQIQKNQYLNLILCR